MLANNFFYYLFFTSSVLIYGIGLSKATVVCEDPRNLFLAFLKMIMTVCSTATLTFIIANNLLVPVHLTEIYPFVAVLIFIGISVFIESIVRLTTRLNASEFSVSFLCVLLAVSESISLTECLLNACTCILSFFIIVPVLYSLKKRIEISNPLDHFKNSSLLLISVALLILIILVWNVSWLNTGVFN